MENKINKSVLYTCYMGFFINGLQVLVASSILTYIMEAYALNYNIAGLLVSVKSIGNLLTGLLSGFAISKFGRKKALIFYSLSIMFGVGGMAFAGNSSVLFILMFLAGIGWGLCNNIMNVVINEITDGDAAYMNLLHMSFAVGAFIAPMMSSFMIQAGLSWRVPVLAVAVFAAISLVVFIKVPMAEPAASQSKKSETKDFSFFKEGSFYLYMVILFCYVGVEMCINSWVVSFLSELKIVSVEAAQNYLSLLWFSIIFGRLAVAYLSSKIQKDKLLTGQCLLLLLSLFLFIINRNAILSAILLFVIGLGLSGMYPTAVSNASKFVKGAGVSSGILFAGGGLGSAVLPYVAGLVSSKNGIFAGMISCFIIVIILFALCIANNVYCAKRAH